MPARKKQKQHQNMINSLKGGERIITAGGIYGTVTRVMDDRFEIQVDGNTKLQITKSLHFHGPGNRRRQEQVIYAEPAG